MSDDASKLRISNGCAWGCLTAIAVILAFTVLIGVSVSFFFSSLTEEFDNCAGLLQKRSAPTGYGEDDYPPFHEVWSSGSEEGGKVVRIPVRGLIIFDGGSWEPGNAPMVLASIRRATADPDVSGIILDINSGGGGITASDIIYNELKNFKAKGGHVVAIFDDLAASGAYYIALAADKIIAHPTTVTGSIGVIMQSYNVKELAQKIGLKDVTIKSGENKDLLNPFQDIKPEQTALFKALIDKLHNRFIGLVAENRKLDIEVVRPLADGRVFLAEDALEAKLIDSIGYWADAETAMTQLLEAEAIYVVRYEEPRNIFDLLRRKGFGFGGLLGSMDEAATPRLMYKGW